MVTLTTGITQLTWGELTPEVFLRDYWQQQPLLIRGALPGFVSPLSAEELAGFSLEEAVESRLIQQTPEQPDWQLRHGPFTEQDYRQLPTSHWTLLVQGVDSLDPRVAKLLDAFRFLPNWRIDDIMASYATRGGNVGPHFDHYDVFLLQGAGQRRWRLGQACDDQTPLLPDCDLRILQDFQQVHEWVLAPGDMLYIPPRLAHWGIAEDDDCITYSIGFRAPKLSEMLSDYCDHLLSQLTNDPHYRDPVNFADQQHPGAIHSTVLTTVHRQLLHPLGDPVQFSEWFGRYMTTPRYPEPPLEDAADTETGQFFRAPGSRFAYIVNSSEPGATLFVNGQQWPVSHSLAEALCDNPSIALPRQGSEEQAVCRELIAQGWLINTEQLDEY